MRGNSSSKQFNGIMEVEKPKQQDDSHLSGAYIRSLVRQLSSPRSKTDGNPAPAKTAALEGAKDGETQEQRPPGSPKSSSSPRPQKKQVRRRLHTTRPYQERLFNMAEARREIVAALKLHRAAMKHQQASNQPHQQTQQQQGQGQEQTAVAAASALQSNYEFSTPFPSLNLLPWSCPPISSLSASDRLNFFHLPDHPLGLNLDLQSFQNIDSTSIYCNQEPSSPPASSLSCSNSSPKAAVSGGVASSSGQQTSRAPPVHPAVDDEEMAEIQSIGEQHDIEWNDKMNSATSAWWSKFLKSMEESDGGVNGSDGLRFFDEFLDSTSMALNESNSLKQQHLDEYFRVEDYLESFDTGEIEYQEREEWLP